MSTWDDVSITCPQCANAFVVQVASGLHISRLPHIRDRILAGTLHRFPCPQCEQPIEVRRPLIYADFDRGDWIEVWPAHSIAQWRELASACQANYTRVFERGAPILRTHVERFRVRIVFGYDELREKLLLWDARLDDIAVECLKLLALRRDVSWLGERDRVLVTSLVATQITLTRFREDIADGSLESECSPEGLAAIRRRVEPVLALADPFVSINRVVGAYAVTASDRDRSDPRGP